MGTSQANKSIWKKNIKTPHYLTLKPKRQRNKRKKVKEDFTIKGKKWQQFYGVPQLFCPRLMDLVEALSFKDLCFLNPIPLS